MHHSGSSERSVASNITSNGKDLNEDTWIAQALRRSGGALQNGPFRAKCIPRLAQEMKHKYEERRIAWIRRRTLAQDADIEGKAEKEERG